MFPLNETNGIIEWVDNLQPFRIILAKLYRQLLGTKKIMKSEEIKKCAATLKDAKEDMKKFQCLLDRHPSVLPNGSSVTFQTLRPGSRHD